MLSNLRRNPIDSSLSARTITDEAHTVAELNELPGVYGFQLDDRPVAGTVSIVTDNTAATPFTIVLTTPAPGQVFVDFNSQRGLCIFHSDDDATAVLVSYSGLGSVNSVENQREAARSAPLTGYSVGANTAVAATDTILEAFGKVQAQINDSAGGVADQTHAATSKTTPVDADELPLADSAASWGLKKLTFANLWAWIKSKFDTLSAGSALGGTEKIPMVQSSSTVYTTPADISTYLANSFQAKIKYAKLSEVKSANTSGGSATATTWTKRQINTEDVDADSIAAVALSVISLIAGTYDCRITSPYYRTGRIITRLRNTSDSTTILNGTSVFSNTSTTSAVVTSEIVGRFTIAATKNFEIQYYVEANTSTQDLGVEANAGVTEVYTIAEFWKVA